MWIMAGWLALALGGLVWKESARLPVGVVGAAAGVCGGQVVLAGGTYWRDGAKHWSDRTARYDGAAGRWMELARLPWPLAYGASIDTGAGLEIFGGNDGERNRRECLTLDAGGTAWRAVGTLPDDRLMAGAARLGDTVYLAGGCADAADFSTCSDSVLVRRGSGAWHRVASIPSGPVALAATAAAGGKLWIFGGAYFDAARTLRNRDQAWCWDPQSKEWTALPPLPRPARGISAVAWGRHVLLVGGYAGEFLDSVLAYDTGKGTYTRWTPLPLPVLLPGVGIAGGELIVAGGEDRRQSRSARTWVALLAGSE